MEYNYTISLLYDKYFLVLIKFPCFLPVVFSATNIHKIVIKGKPSGTTKAKLDKIK